MTIQGGEKMTSWFDIELWPVGLNEPDGPTGMDVTVQLIHKTLDEIVAGGVPSEKIILGGFSQGGCSSILAGLTYPKKLAGIVAISGWVAYREGNSMASRVHSANKETPMFFTAGTGDPIVVHPLTKRSGEILETILGDHVTVNHANRQGHPPNTPEMQLASQFISDKLEL